MNLKEIVPLEWRGQRVLTTTQLAQAYGYNDNSSINKIAREHNEFVEGEHYFDLSGLSLREFKALYNLETRKKLRLWAKSGAKLYAEISRDRKLLDAYEWLAENYFEQAAITEITTPAETSEETALQAYVNDAFGEIRGMLIDGEPYFVGKDVASALGYADVNHAILDHVDNEDRINSKTQGQNAPELGQRGSWLINESGLYSLILSSKLPSAKSFKRWVTSEVLPSIRKTGEYKVASVPAPANTQTPLSEIILQVGATRDAIKSVFGVGALREGIALAKSIDMASKYYGADLSMLNDYLPPATHKVGHLTASMIGNKLGISAQAVNENLKAMGLQYKDKKGNWILTDAGVAYGEMMPYVNKYSGHTGYYPLWNDSVMNLFDAPRLF